MRRSVRNEFVFPAAPFPVTGLIPARDQKVEISTSRSWGFSSWVRVAKTEDDRGPLAVVANPVHVFWLKTGSMVVTAVFTPNEFAREAVPRLNPFLYKMVFLTRAGPLRLQSKPCGTLLNRLCSNKV